MLLSDYLKGKDKSEFAKAVGVTAAAVRHWLNGLRLPRIEQARKIVLVTRGKVKMTDIYR
jgi:hypothetical protein